MKFLIHTSTSIILLCLLQQIYTGPVASTMATVAGVSGSLTGLFPNDYRPKVVLFSESLKDGAQIAFAVENLVPYFKNAFVKNMHDLQNMFDCIKNSQNVAKKKCIAQTLRKISTTLSPLSDNLLGKVISSSQNNKIVNTIEPGFLMTIAHSKLLPESKRINMSNYIISFNKIYDMLDFLAVLFDPEKNNL
ncbi:MAG: hypothetical protein WC707_03530 [Candidatus Babeliaceae bacterium]|jgi:hypothetical protein